MREIVTSPLVHPRFGEDDDSSRTRSGQVTKPASGYPSPQTVGAPTTSAPSSPGGRTVPVRNRSGLGGRGDGYPLVGMLTRTGCARMRSYRLRVRCNLFAGGGTRRSFLAGLVSCACRSAHGPGWSRHESSLTPGRRRRRSAAFRRWFRSAQGWCRSARTSPRAGGGVIQRGNLTPHNQKASKG